MPQKVFSLSTLADLDGGKANMAINHAIRQVIQDVKSRPADKTKRKVQVTIEMTPQLNNDLGVLDTIGTQIKIKSMIPLRQTSVYPMLPIGDQGAECIAFQTETPMDPRQNEFDFTDSGETVDRTTGEVVSDDDEEVQNL